VLDPVVQRVAYGVALLDQVRAVLNGRSKHPGGSVSRTEWRNGQPSGNGC
jgi:hypothetical protein